MTRSPGAGRGSVTVLLCGVVALVGLLSLGTARLGVAAVAVARAETAADAAALAAAAELAAGRSPAAAERTAQRTASRNGARFLHCSCQGGQATVSVAVPLPRVPSFSKDTRATARAELHTDCPG